MISESINEILNEQINKELSTRFKEYVLSGKISVDIAYTNCVDRAEEFKDEVNIMLKKYGLKVGRVNPLSLSVACHIGDGAIAIAISRKF